MFCTNVKSCKHCNSVRRQVLPGDLSESRESKGTRGRWEITAAFLLCPSLLRLTGLLRPLRSSARELAKGNAAQGLLAEWFWRKAGAFFCPAVPERAAREHWLDGSKKQSLAGGCSALLPCSPCPFSALSASPAAISTVPCSKGAAPLLPHPWGAARSPPAPQLPSTYSWKR